MKGRNVDESALQRMRATIRDFPKWKELVDLIQLPQPKTQTPEQQAGAEDGGVGSLVAGAASSMRLEEVRNLFPNIDEATDEVIQDSEQTDQEDMDIASSDNDDCAIVKVACRCPDCMQPQAGRRPV